MLVLQGAVHVNEHYKKLTPTERDRLQRLIRKSRGRPSNLTPREREAFKKLVAKLDLTGLGRELLPFAGGRGRGRRGR
jgi:hypothetical protein